MFVSVCPPDLKKLESYSQSTFNISFTHGLKSHNRGANFLGEAEFLFKYK